MLLAKTRCLLIKGILSTMTALMGVCISSCDSMIYDDQGDCSVHYRLNFRYTKNILDVDAFSSQVTGLNVAVYDKSGRMILHKTDKRTPSQENDYSMEIDIAPGVYDIIAWCEGESVIPEASSFTLRGQNVGNDIKESGAYLTPAGNDSERYYDHDLNRLYYGSLTDVTFPDSYGTIDITPIYLTRDTNHLIVQLQNQAGKTMDPSQLEFEIEAANSELDWNNTIEGDLKFTYRPWSVRSTYTDNPDSGNDENQEGNGEGNENRTKTRAASDDYVPTGVQAEFTTGRIMANREQILTVRLKETGEQILSIPLVEYLLLVRGMYEQAKSDQEYLDRYDDFTLVFFVEEGFSWVKTRVLINGWRIVPPQNGNL